MVRISLTYETVSAAASNKALANKFDKSKLPATPLPETLLGDSVRLKQILINLVKNSFKFTKRGCIRVIASYDGVNEIL